MDSSIPQMTDVHFFGNVRRRKVDHDSTLARNRWRMNAIPESIRYRLRDVRLVEKDVDKPRSSNLKLERRKNAFYLKTSSHRQDNTQSKHFMGIWKEGRKEMFYLMTLSTHFIYGYMASDIW